MAAHHFLPQEEFDTWLKNKEVRLKVTASIRKSVGGGNVVPEFAQIWGEADREACKGNASYASLSACEDSSAGLYLSRATYKATKNILPNVMFWSLIQIALLGLILWRVW